MAPDIKLIIGLGNPGKQYQNTYHNIGHLFTETTEKLKAKNWQSAGPAIIRSAQSYMNESGLFVKQQLKKYKIQPKNLLVVHDDSDIELGKVKLAFGRGSAGHKGVKNIIDQLKTQNFWRFRIGIRPPDDHPRKKAQEFILKKISPTNKKVLERIFQDSLNNLLS